VCAPCVVHLYEIVVFVELSLDAQSDIVGYPSIRNVNSKECFVALRIELVFVIQLENSSE
jgi:hypothetical protein